MNSIKPPRLLFCPLALLTFGPIATAADQNAPKPDPLVVTDTRTVTHENQVTPHEAQVMSSDAVATLKHIADARGYIHDKKYDLAKVELGQATSLLSTLHSDMPQDRIKDRIAIAQKHLQIDTPQTVTADMVPIYSDLAYVQKDVPVKTVKNHLDNAKSKLQAGDKNGAMTELKAADAAIAYTQIDLPVKETQAKVKVAIQDLNRSKPAQADQALKEAEGNLSVNYAEMVVTPASQAGVSSQETQPTNSLNQGQHETGPNAHFKNQIGSEEKRLIARHSTSSPRRGPMIAFRRSLVLKVCGKRFKDEAMQFKGNLDRSRRRRSGAGVLALAIKGIVG